MSSVFDPAYAEEISTTETATSSLANRKQWGLKLEHEIKSIKDKKNTNIGFEAETQLTLTSMQNENWGFVAGLDLVDVQKKDTPRKQILNETSLGVRYILQRDEQDWKLNFTHNWGIESRALEADLKTRFKFKSSLQTKLRVNFRENIADLEQKNIERRRLKLEVTPEIKSEHWAVGPQLKFNAKSWLDKDQFVAELNPFIKYENSNIEIILKQIYRPFISTEDPNWAPAWTNKSITSLQVELSI